MTPDQIRNEIDRLISDMLEVELAIDFNSSVVISLEQNVKIATWARYNIPSTDVIFTTIDEYRWFVQNRHYSLVLFDGSLFQISYKFKRSEVVEHRLCFYPCPFMLSPEEWEVYQEAGFGLLDILDNFNFKEFQSHLRLQSPIRFDFALEMARENHPASHLHVLRAHCRIPVYAPLSIGHFVQFVFKNFYPEQWGKYEFLREWPCQPFDRTITAQQEKQIHMNLLIQ